MCCQEKLLILQEVLNKITDKSITDNIIRIENVDYIKCRFYCITFVEYMLAGKNCQTIPGYFLWMPIKIRGITSSAIGLTICTITTVIKRNSQL